MPDLVNLIQTYTELFGPSGDEDLVIRTFKNDMVELGLEPSVDKLGNVIVPVKQPDAGYPHVMVSAHLDEIGFVIRKIEQDGFLRVHRVGGIHDQVIAGQRITFRTSTGFIDGHVGVKAKHLSKPDELQAAITVDDAFIDVLAPTKAAAEELGLEVGTFGVYKSELTVRGDLISGKAMDNRVGIVTLLELARALQNEQPHPGVTLVGTVQEEYSVRGGVTAARSVRPDFALCLDIAIATDTPGMKEFGDVILGGGPALTRFTRANLNGIIPNPKLVQFVKNTARAQGIPLQNSVLQGGLTDGSYMQYEGDGIPTLDLSFATRYTHTPVETCSLTDIRQLHQLALAALHSAPKGFDLSRG